jgi:hypothetical protein
MTRRSAYHRSKVAKTPEELAADVAAIEAALKGATATVTSKKRKKVAETVKEDK